MAELSVSQAREQSLQQELQIGQGEKKAEVTKLQYALRDEKETTQKLTTLVQTSRAAEDALSHEVEQYVSSILVIDVTGKY